jgi:hypothetical protein
MVYKLHPVDMIDDANMLAVWTKTMQEHATSIKQALDKDKRCENTKLLKSVHTRLWINTDWITQHPLPDTPEDLALRVLDQYLAPPTKLAVSAMIAAMESIDPSVAADVKRNVRSYEVAQSVLKTVLTTYTNALFVK